MVNKALHSSDQTQKNITIKEALQNARPFLENYESGLLDAEVLLAFVLGRPREYLYTWPEKTINFEQQELFSRHCLRRQKGHPIAYLVGQRSFWDFDLSVDKRVLIPRPETELLVETVLEKINIKTAKVADLGTGSGAIAIALAKEKPDWQIIATDISEQALSVAKSNAKKIDVDNIAFFIGSWCDSLNAKDFDVIISNPPYIDKEDEHLNMGDLRFEPELALVAANKGLADIMLIAQQSTKKLKNGGYLMLEHGYQQADQVLNILNDLGYSHCATYKDLAGIDRVSLGQWQLL